MDFPHRDELRSGLEQLADGAPSRSGGSKTPERLAQCNSTVTVLIARPAWVSFYRLLTSDAPPELVEIRDRILAILNAKTTKKRSWSKNRNFNRRWPIRHGRFQVCRTMS